jgi:hypothetical protein
VAASALLLSPLPAFAKPRLTPDEQLNISIFKASTPSVVNVTNLASRRDQFTTSMMEIPQGAGSGFIWDKDGHVSSSCGAACRHAPPRCPAAVLPPAWPRLLRGAAQAPPGG